MKIAIFAYSRQGCRTARKTMSYFPEAEIKAYTMERFIEKGFPRSVVPQSHSMESFLTGRTH